MADDTKNQNIILVARASNAEYKFLGFCKVHVKDLVFPISVLIPELLEDEASEGQVGEDQVTTFYVETEEDLEDLLPEDTKYVWVHKNEMRAKKPDSQGSGGKKGGESRPKRSEHNSEKEESKVEKDRGAESFASLGIELARSKTFFTESHIQTRHILDSVRQQGIVPVQEVVNIVDEITSSIARNKNALLCMRGLQSATEYAYYHSINVSLFATVFAQYLGYSDDEVWNIGLAGILHDIGKQRIPLKVINANRKLTDEEFAIIKLHPQAACEVLRDVKGISEGVMKAITCHHEKFDGTGYPFGLKGDEIHPYAAIVALADTYDALTSVRPNKQAMSSAKTASLMFQQKGTSFEPELVDKFIRCFGVYPIGTLVRLSNSDCAIVYESNHEDLLNPMVLKLTRRYESFIPNRAIPLDLRTVKDTIKIVGGEDCKKYGIDLKKVLATFDDKLVTK